MSDLSALQVLAGIARAEGYRFVERFVTELASSAGPEPVLAGFIAILDQGQLVAFGGVTPDPYYQAADVARLRHVYVRPDRRGGGIGRRLVTLLEAQAVAAGIHLLRLRTDTVAAAQFYQRLGYAAVVDATATHQRPLVQAGDRQPNER